MTNATLIAWAFVTTVLAVMCRRGRIVYFSSCVLAVIPIVISQREFELLPMAGIAHVFMAGIYPLAVFGAVKLYRRAITEKSSISENSSSSPNPECDEE